jgi:hypothetical protein
MLHIPLTKEKLHELQFVDEDEDPDIFEKKHIFHCLKKNLNLKLKYEIMNMGTHGVVISPSFSINKNNNIISKIDNLNLDDDFISKILDLHNEEMIYIQKEIQISKKLKVLDEKYENFIYPTSYEKIDSNFYNIIMKKGYDFESNLLQLNYKQLLKTLYNLVDSIQISSDNNILLLDLKPTNFLFSKIDDKQYKSVIIDFSGELLIENIKDFYRYLNNFEFYCHDFWPFELTILLHRMGLKKGHCNIKEQIIEYNEMKKNKIGNKNNDYELTIYSYLLDELDKLKSKETSELYQKIMIYQIGKSWEYILYKYRKSLKLTKIQYSIFNTFISKITNEDYFKRYNIQKFKNLLIKHNPELENSLIKIDKIL